jgi:TetR/AcrR family transcriptional regulator
MARTSLEQAALQLFALHGYAGTSVRAIVEAAGVTKPALYYHFGSKEGLYSALLTSHLKGWLDLVQSIVTSEASVQDRVQRYVQTAVHGAIERPLAVRFVHRACAHTEQNTPQLDLDWQQQEASLLHALVLEGVERGELTTRNPRESALALMAMLQWRAFASLHPDAPLVPEVADHIVDIWLKGVGA